jgi:predicted permease
MFGWFNDFRYALRQIRRQPAHAAFVVLTLAVGIGATTAVFSVVRGVLLRPLPYPESDRLVAVWGRFLPESGFDFPQFSLSVPEYLDYKAATRAMQDVALFQTGSATVGADEGAPERVRLAAMTPNTLALLRVPVAHGRDFLASDGIPNAPRVVILGHGYWQRRFGGDPGVVGRTMRVSGTDRTIVGIAPAGFGFPARDIELWQPFVIDPASPGGRSSHGQRAVARLADGATLGAAEAEMATLMAQWKAQYPTVHTGHFLFLRPMLEDVVGPVSQILVLLLAATGVLLLIVCANVSNILLARGEGRVREMAIRAALGAERRRLVRLAAIESLMLATAGGALALAVAWAGIRALRALEGSGVPRVDAVSIDAGVLVFAAGVTMCSAIVFGLAPALRGSMARPGAAMRLDDRTSSADGARLRFRRALVAVEVGLTVVLVVSAALMLQSLRRVLTVDPGFDPRGVVLASVDLPSTAYPDHERVQQFYRGVIERLRSVPGVSGATAASLVPVLRGSGVWDFQIAGRPAPAAGAPAWNAAGAVIRDGYFDALGMPVREGRAITADDGLNQPPVAVVNESFARKFLAGERAIGQRIRLCCDETRPWATIVGVVGDVRDQDLETAARPIYYLSHAQVPQTAFGTFASMAIVARSDRPDAVGPALRQIVRERDPDLPVTVQQYQAQIGLSYAQRSFATALFAVFAGVGLLLGATGIYAVLAYGVARLTPEIGIRRALGATSGSIAGIVLRQGLVPAAIGLAMGLAAALGLSRFLESQLFEVSPMDASVYAGVAAGVLMLAAASCLVPARRAMRVSPLRALREV